MSRDLSKGWSIFPFSLIACASLCWMLLMCLGLLGVVGSPVAVAQVNRVGEFKFDKKQGSHTGLVTFRTQPFQRTKHRVTKDRQSQTIVDGKFALGTDGNIPNVEIVSIKVLFDGRELAIPRKLYADCFEPNLNDQDLSMRFDRNFQSLIVSMSGSDGAGGYEVVWRFRKDSRHTRSVKRGF